MIWGYHYFRKHPDLNLGNKNILNVNDFINCPSILQAPFFNSFPRPHQKKNKKQYTHTQPTSFLFFQAANCFFLNHPSKVHISGTSLLLPMRISRLANFGCCCTNSSRTASCRSSKLLSDCNKRQQANSTSKGWYLTRKKQVVTLW